MKVNPFVYLGGAEGESHALARSLHKGASPLVNSPEA